ncbi:MAG TPA: ATP-binding protein [Chthoniobacterales bacterium]|nr:ATP-binding protein [Chthoniobacterales bacterium]
MKVQTKITLLLVLVVATFLAGLFAFRAYDRLKFRRIADERFAERNRSFDNFLTKHGEKLETLALYDSASDQMVRAIATNDLQWFRDNIARARLESFGANAAWIYGPDGVPAYQVNNLSSENLPPLPIPREGFARVFEHKEFAHFFTAVPQGVMEIRAAIVHPAKDFKRVLPPSGFFFVGRLWSRPALDEMSMFTGNTVKLMPPVPSARENYNDEYGLLAFSQPLYSWDGKPIAQLVVRNQSPVIGELRRSSERLLLSLILFALILFLLLMTSLVRWVRRPLRQIMASLTQNDPKPIERLARDRGEFGELARTVQKFFDQRDNLLREMEERRSTEEALRHSEEELRHSQKMEAVGRLAGGIAHDFNNLLTAIIGYAELINACEWNDAVVRQHADLIRKAGEQAATLTRQLLAFSRKQLLQPRVIDLNHLVVDMENLLRRVIGERFRLQTRAEAETGTVMADPSQIEQVILNLGVNARDAMPSGGDLIIRTANVHLDKWRAPQISVSLAAGDYVELSVTDTGIGMDEATKSRIFEPFFTTKGPGKGTGLGLATVYGIVRQSGGGICVDSHPGMGSTFRIYLPLDRSPAERAQAELPPVEKSQNYETVLVVEDEEIVRELVCDVLSEQGYYVLCAPDGHVALQLAGDFDGQIHLMITDVIMPHMNGPELATRLAVTRPEMKVLYVSGYSDNDIGNHGVLESQIDLLQKPFTPQTLARKIRDVLQKRHHAQTTSV